MFENKEILTNKREKLFPMREIVCYALGLACGLFLLVYGIFIKNSMTFTVFGIAILGAEAYLYLNARKDNRSYIQLDELQLRGCGYDMGSRGLLADFEMTYRAVTGIQPDKDGFLVIKADKKAYRVRAAGIEDDVIKEVKKRMK